MGSPIVLYPGTANKFEYRGGSDEISTQESLLFNNFIQGSYNPDSLVNKKGDLKVYQKMLIDEQTHSPTTYP